MTTPTDTPRLVNGADEAPATLLLADELAVRGCLCLGSCRADDYHLSPVLLSLGLQQGSELPPTRVRKRAGQLLVLQHPRHVQLFQHHRLLLTSDRSPVRNTCDRKQID